MSGKRYWDPPLTARGRHQAYSLRHSLIGMHPSFRVDEVVTSPFRRTLQTALLGLPQYEAFVTSFPLRNDAEEVQRPPPAITVTELLRERVGGYTSDARSDLTTLAAEVTDCAALR